MKGELVRVRGQEVPERESGWWSGGPHLPQQENDQPQQQQPGTHSHKHQPQLDLRWQLLHQVRVNVHGELAGGEKGLSPVSTPLGPKAACSPLLSQLGPGPCCLTSYRQGALRHQEKPLPAP